VEEVSGWWRVVALVFLVIYIWGIVLMIQEEIQIKKELEKQKICYYEICKDNIYIDAFYEDDVCYCYEMDNDYKTFLSKTEYMK
jgi:hypothetical protein